MPCAGGAPYCPCCGGGGCCCWGIGGNPGGGAPPCAPPCWGGAPYCWLGGGGKPPPPWGGPGCMCPPCNVGSKSDSVNCSAPERLESSGAHFAVSHALRLHCNSKVKRHAMPCSPIQSCPFLATPLLCAGRKIPRNCQSTEFPCTISHRSSPLRAQGHIKCIGTLVPYLTRTHPSCSHGMIASSAQSVCTVRLSRLSPALGVMMTRCSLLALMRV